MNRVLVYVIVFFSISVVTFVVARTALTQEANTVYPQSNGFGELLTTASPQPTPTPTVRLLAVGDVMLGRSVNTKMVSKADWKYPFLETAEFLKTADITFGNLESPFGFTCPISNEGFVFCADRRSVEGLVYAGFDVMSLANNHINNQGSEGVKLTEEVLTTYTIAGITHGNYEIFESNGITVGIIAYDATMQTIDIEQLKATVSVLKNKSDIVVVSFHWGVEYVTEPSKEQVELGRAAIDAGGSLVIGHHPHWIQSVEEYNDGVIVYSLGNFVFDQMWSEETRTGHVGEFVLTDEGVASYQFKLVKIYDYAQPRFE